MTALTPEQTNSLYNQLVEERDAIIQFREEAKESLKDSTGELSTVDNHPADAGTELFERSRDLVLDQAEEQKLAEIEAALGRITDGTYGICEVSGEPIPFDRLEAIPWTRYHVEHAPQHPSTDRPVEEEIMEPGRGVTDQDAIREESSRDDNDAWRIVAGYGNSDSPAMADDPDEFHYTPSDDGNGDGYVEKLESFTATDMKGKQRGSIRSETYKEYVDDKEGDRKLEAAEQERVQERDKRFK
jgi:YteA family regulatory protein